LAAYALQAARSAGQVLDKDLPGAKATPAKKKSDK
jgi:hypothetical protein